eukprot:705912-Rhodomonas_salina.1
MARKKIKRRQNPTRISTMGFACLVSSAICRQACYALFCSGPRVRRYDLSTAAACGATNSVLFAQYERNV